VGGGHVSKNVDFIPDSPIRIVWDPRRLVSQERVFMNPKRFLELTSSFKLRDKSLDFIDKQVREEGVMYAPFLYIDVDSGKVLSHEGRHRAYWAYKNDLPYIPVMIFHKKLVDDPFYGEVHRYVPVKESMVNNLVQESDSTAWDSIDGNRYDFNNLELDKLHEFVKISHENNRELGTSILEGFYLDEISEGYDNQMWIEEKENEIGSFHTHPDSKPWLSTPDIISSVTKGHSVVCIGGISLKGKIMRSQINCYVADPNSGDYHRLRDLCSEYSVFLPKERRDNLIKDIHELGIKTFKKYELGSSEFN
jgi:proteasome lid subunit RPN8/RPN11